MSDSGRKINVQQVIELSADDEKALQRYFEEVRQEDETFLDWYKSTFLACGHDFFEGKISDYGRMNRHCDCEEKGTTQ